MSSPTPDSANQTAISGANSSANPATDADAILLRDDRDGITTLTLNRPSQFNALSEEMLAALQTELERCDNDDSVRVVVIAARGRAYCAGHDLKQMMIRQQQDYYCLLYTSPSPRD